MDPKLYVCDLDGTLLRPDATLSAFSREGLNLLLVEGVRLTVASARGTPGMRALLAGVELDLPVIELNGAFVSELASGRHHVSNVLQSAEACAAVEVILSAGDHLNDLSMLAAASHSVAPANAHPDVLASVAEVVGSNEEDGIVRHLLDLHGLA